MSCDNHHGNGEPAKPDPTREPSPTPPTPPPVIPEGELLQVDLEPAWAWTCPRCQTMNYIADTGEMQASVVTCCLCNTTYESNEPAEEIGDDIDDDDIDDDWDDEDEYCLDDDDDDDEFDDDSDIYDDDDDGDDFYDWDEDDDDFLGDDGLDTLPGGAA